MGILRHSFCLDAEEILQDFFHQLILAKSIYKIHAGFPAANLNGAVNQIKAFVHLEPVVQIIHILP